MGWLDKLRHGLRIGGSQSDEESQPRSIKISEIQSSSDWGTALGGIIKELEFHATLQLRTPLRVLTKHGEIHKDHKLPPPAYAKEQWEGIWLPKTDFKSDFFSKDATMATEIGPMLVDHDVRLVAFLIAVREAVETELPIEGRRKRLKELLSTTEWPELTMVYGENTQSISPPSMFGGDTLIVDRLFPPFLKTISGLSKDSVAELYQANLKTPMALEKSSDKELLKIKGIGPSKLKKIREICSTVSNKHCEWTDVPGNKPG